MGCEGEPHVLSQMLTLVARFGLGPQWGGVWADTLLLGLQLQL